MSQSKTDKIRERLEALRFRAEKYEHGATTFDVDRLIEALEAVVEETDDEELLDIIAQELDVEEK